MTYGQTLIDSAKEKVGSYYKLWKLTGLAQSTLSDIRAGKRQLPIEQVPVMSSLAGLDVKDSTEKVMIEQVKCPIKRQRLIDLLQRGAGAGTVCLFAMFFMDTPSAATLLKTVLTVST